MELKVTDSAPPYRIRRATTADATTLARLGAALFAQAFAERNTAEDMRDYLATAFGDDQQRRELASPHDLVWLAEDHQGRPIGYAHVKLHSSPTAPVLTNAAELSRIYTDRTWHGQGVGAALLQTCIDEAARSGASSLWLGVWKENPRGIAFYQKHGFRTVGEHTFQLGTDPQHDWIMVRDLRQL